MSKKPNILFLFTDQQRPDSLGCYGSKEAITPNIDALAKEGMVFDNCYVQNPLCCPSRYSILSGMYPHEHGVISNWHAPKKSVESFGHALGRVGYSTSLIGKMHFTPWQDCFGFDGRIIAEAKFHTDCSDDYQRFLERHNTSREKLYDLLSDEYINNCTAVDSKVPKELHIDSFVGMSVMEYLKKVDGPFCCFASFLSPHNPYDPPKEYKKMFEDAKLPRKVMEKNEIKNKPSEAYDYINDRLKWPFKTDELTDRQIEGTKKNYYSLNTLIDDWIGEIINTLKQRGIYEDTIIIYSSDHGDLLGDHGLVYKQCFYEQSVKVPLIVCCPKRFKKGRSDALVESLDLYKTIIDMGCAEPTQKTHSKSLMPVLQGERQHHREYVVSENYFGNMIRNKRFKMVYYKGKPYGELYDLINDHQEFVNLWDDEKYNAAKTDLKEKLLDWYAKTAETGLNPVRGNHFDKTPLEYEMKDGAANLIANQSWQLSFMREFYESF